MIKIYRRLWIVYILLFFINSCDVGSNKKKGDKDFVVFSKNFIADLWKINPSWAAGVGYHAYDSILVVPNSESDQKSLEFSERFLDSIKMFDYNQLSRQHQTDFLLIKNYLEGNIFYIKEFKSGTWDASIYNFGATLFEITNNKAASPKQIMYNIDHFLSKVEAYYLTAQSNLTNPTKEHTELAIDQLAGTISMLQDGEISAYYKVHGGDRIMLDSAANVIARFRVHLQKILVDIDAGRIKARSFRIGKELHKKKFDFEIQSSFTSEEIFAKATARKTSLTAEMFAVAQRLWPKYLPHIPIEKDTLLCIQTVIDKVALKHCKREDFQSEIARQIPILTQFVKDKDLVTMDPKKPLEVRPEPAYMAGVAGASISSPGPYDKEGMTYYNVGSLEKYSPEAAESYLREYNHFTLQVLNIHEAIPGHYIQLIHSNKTPSLIQSILQNGAFIEGWAVYTERMMMEEGFDKNTSLNSEPMPDEMWLMYSKFHLRAVCNNILDYSVHCLGMSKAAALQLLMKEAFQEKSEAEGKWKRATLTQVQLSSYYTGFYEIYSFRDEIKKKLGSSFQLKKFNDQILSFGSPPVKYLKELFKL